MPKAKSSTHTLCELRSRNAFHISQGILHKNLQIKCCRPRPRTTLCASLRSRNALGQLACTRIYMGKMPQAKSAAHTSCEPAPAQSTCTWTCQKHSQAILHNNLHIQCRRPRPLPTLCASLRSRNAFDISQRAILHKNLQVKCRRQRARPTLCASCAVEMHLDVSYCKRICR